MDEINEQAENMKQIQEVLSNPIGAAADFDEICDGGGSEVTPFADRKNKKLKWRSEYKQKKSICIGCWWLLALQKVLTTRTLFRCITHKCCRFERQTRRKRS
ncbi:hypothetical protein C5167_027261 [Papaver somniferum]|nr:hypothetical protein C5167_027261 [Papaver somniferum]